MVHSFFDFEKQQAFIEVLVVNEHKEIKGIYIYLLLIILTLFFF